MTNITAGVKVEIMEQGKWVGPFLVTALEGRTPDHLVLSGPSGFFETYNDAPYNVRLFVPAPVESVTTTYPIHTPLAAITKFDRSTKVHFECMIHEGSKWMSKQPSCSHWFASWGNAGDCDCDMGNLNNWWTTGEYTA